MEHYGYDTEDLSLEDLLEIFQGPVPLEGSIIFATTNKYDEIKKLCPALFRPGRLTPIHFDNATNTMADELCQYFYNKSFSQHNPEIIIKPEHEIAPSQLIEYASESKLMEVPDPYDYFVQCVKGKLVGS